MGCRKYSPGTPCCCVKCCIARVEIDLAVPDEGEPGASLGTFGWDIEEEPYLREYLDSGQKVCEYTYIAPQFNICSPGSYLVNAWYPQINRTINADSLFCIGQGANRYTGSCTWKTNEFLRNARLLVSSRGSMIRRTLTADIFSEFVVYPTPGGILNTYNIYGGYCYDDFTLTYTNDYDIGVCIGSVLNNPCPGDTQPAFQIRTGFYSTSLVIDSGWVNGNCDTLETDVSISSRWSEYDGDYPNVDDSCRIPSGSTPSNPGLGCACGTNLEAANTYSPLLEWTCKHTLRVILCT